MEEEVFKELTFNCVTSKIGTAQYFNRLRFNLCIETGRKLSQSPEKQSMKQVRLRSDTFPNTKKRVENTTRSGIFLMNFKTFGNVFKRFLECLIYLLNPN